MREIFFGPAIMATGDCSALVMLPIFCQMINDFTALLLRHVLFAHLQKIIASQLRVIQ
jgi:hypothetical protein